MLFDVIYPKKISSKGLDGRLSQGWFRHGQCFQKPALICIDDLVCDVINIRLNINKHNFSKSQQKLLRKNDKRFSVKIGKANITEEKESLYQQHQFRFTGFITESLDEFLNFGFTNSIFDTYEVSVFDNDKLVAFSYFDLGNNSMATLLGVIDWNYKKASLGIYTMLKELELAKQKKMKFYYPGPITVQSSTFDYKLNIGNFAYLAKTKRWRKLIDKQTDTYFTNIINEKTLELEQVLSQHKTTYHTYIYPSYAIDFIPINFSDLGELNFLNTCKLIIINTLSKKRFEIAYYDLMAGQFKLAIAKKVNPKSIGVYRMSKTNYIIKSIYTHLLQIVECKKIAVTAVDLFS